MKQILLCSLNFRHNELLLTRRIGVKTYQEGERSAHRITQHIRFGTLLPSVATSYMLEPLSEIVPQGIFIVKACK